VQRKPLAERGDAVDYGNAWHQYANDDMAPVVSRGTAGGGHALDSDTRRFMEARFGRTFGSVRIHTGEAAAESTRSVNAVAYTVGNQIVFGAGHYAPGTTAGRRLLAHELAHTIQQGGAGPANTNRAASAITAGAGDVVQRVGECDGKSFRECSGGCVPADGRGTGFCRWGMSPVTKESACICFRRDQPMLRAIQQALYNMIIAALFTAGIVLTAAAIAAIIACLSGPCEVAALIAALGYAGAMIVLGIVRSGGGSGTSGGPPQMAPRRATHRRRARQRRPPSRRTSADGQTRMQSVAHQGDTNLDHATADRTGSDPQRRLARAELPLGNQARLHAVTRSVPRLQAKLEIGCCRHPARA